LEKREIPGTCTENEARVSGTRGILGQSADLWGFMESMHQAGPARQSRDLGRNLAPGRGSLPPQQREGFPSGLASPSPGAAGADDKAQILALPVSGIKDILLSSPSRSDKGHAATDGSQKVP